MSGAPILEGVDVLTPLDTDPAPRGRPKISQRTGDRFAVLNGFVDFALATVHRTDAAVWLVLYRDTQRDGIAQTGKTDIARRAGVGARTVTRAIQRLEAKRLLIVVRRGGLNRGTSAYRVRGVPHD